MSGGKRFKWQGSIIAVMTGYVANSPSKAITAITAADPPVCTCNTHGLETGDVIQIDGAGGMEEANGVWVVEKLSANTFSLFGADGTAWGTYTTGARFDVGAFSNFCELTGYNRNGGSSPEIGATTICSDAQEFEIGLPDFGTTQLDFNFAPRTAVQQAIADFYSGDNAGEVWAVRITLPRSGGKMVQLGYIQQTSEQSGNGNIWTASLTVRNTGERFDYI